MSPEKESYVSLSRTTEKGCDPCAFGSVILPESPRLDEIASMLPPGNVPVTFAPFCWKTMDPRSVPGMLVSDFHTNARSQSRIVGTGTGLTAERASSTGTNATAVNAIATPTDAMRAVD